MLLPNTHSFLLRRKHHVASRPSYEANTVAQAIFHEQTTGTPLKGLKQTTESKIIFLPSTDSFILVGQKHITGPRSSVFLPHKHSFQLMWSQTPAAGPPPDRVQVEEGFPQSDQSADSEQMTVDDQKKRAFLRAIGVTGVGLIASQMLPKQAQALVLGSSPTTGVVGVKNASNARINPATEETAANLLKTSDLTFDAGALQVKVTSVSGGSGGSSSFSDSGDVAKSALVDGDRHVQVDVLTSGLPSDAATQTTLDTISFGGKQFALKMTTVGDVDYIGEAAVGTATSAALWRAKKVDSTSGILITWADGNANFDNVATDLTTLTYS